MYCKNCGHTVKGDKKFCVNCGHEVKGGSVESYVPIETHDERWWYRFLKVVYIVTFTAVIGGGLAVAYSEMPHKWIDSSSSTIHCDNGKIYELSRNGLYAFGSDLDVGTDKDARILCEHDTLNFYLYSNVHISKNYEFIPHYVDADYTSWFWESLMWLALAWVILKLVRIGVHYVAFGNKPQWKREFKKWY